MAQRLSVCYAAPGHALLSTSGATRNILSLAGALSHWADVTVAFRHVLEPIKAEHYRVVAIEPYIGNYTNSKDDLATRGLNPISYISYLHALRSFSKRWAHAYDLVLEKGWHLSGLLSAAFRLQGVPGVLVENDVRRWSEPIGDLRTVIKYILHNSAQFLAGFYSRQVPITIAETDELKEMLVRQRGIAPDKITVVGLGVDHALFYPKDQEVARRSLDISPAVTVLLYVGGMDKYHDLGPMIQALTQIRLPSFELHLVGDGEYRTQYEEKARRARISVQFHGHVPHALVSDYIAAADLCIAPYQTNAFHDQLVTFSTLKIPEYMACGRPVVSVPSGNIRRLIENQVSGFLFPNDVDSWASFFVAPPSREQLQEMGRAAAQAVQPLSWEKTSAQYFDVCQALLGPRAGSSTSRTS
jgi:glycosyltransferase involved in cell wall biosynthesis